MNNSILLRAFISILFLCAPTFVLAQVSQRGFVKEYNEKDEKTPLSNVEIVVDKAGTTVSGKDGRFILQFQTLKAGDQVYLKRLGKKGYELFNTDAVKQWNISKEDKPFTIVMCRTDIFKRICDNYAKTSYASYARQHKADSVKLAEERVNGKLKESEYKEKLAQLQQRYEQDLKNINKYVERFARIDLSELSDKEKQITNLIGIGEIDKANELYEEMQIEKKIAEKIKNIKAVEEAEKAFEQQKIKEKAEKDSLFNIFMRSIDALKLAGGVENFMKIDKKFRDVIDMDSTNISALVEYATFSLDQHDELKAENSLKKIENLLGKNENDTLIWVYMEYATINFHKGNYQKAEDYLAKAQQANRTIHDHDSKEYLLQGIVGLSTLAEVYDFKGDIDYAWECYEKLDTMLTILSKKDSIEYLKAEKLVVLNEAKFYQDHGVFEKSDSIYNHYLDLIRNEEVTDSVQHNFILLLAELNYSSSLTKRGNYNKAEQLLTKWLPYIEKQAKITPSSYGEILFQLKYGLSELYHLTKQYDKYLDIIDDTQSYLIEMTNYSPYNFAPLLTMLQISAGYRLGQQKDYENALEILKRARHNIQIGIGDFPSMRDRYMSQGILADVNTGFVYDLMGDHSNSELYWLSAIAKEDSIQHLEDGHFDEAVLNAYGNLGSLYYRQGKYDLAQEYISRYFGLLEGIPNGYIFHGDMMRYNLESMQDIFMQQGELDKALECVKSLITYSVLIENKRKEAIYHLSASQIYLDLKKKKDSKREWKEAEKCDSEYVAKHGQILSKKIFGK